MALRVIGEVVKGVVNRGLHKVSQGLDALCRCTIRWWDGGCIIRGRNRYVFGRVDDIVNLRHDIFYTSDDLMDYGDILCNFKQLITSFGSLNLPALFLNGILGVYILLIYRFTPVLPIVFIILCPFIPRAVFVIFVWILSGCWFIGFLDCAIF